MLEAQPHLPSHNYSRPSRNQAEPGHSSILDEMEGNPFAQVPKPVFKLSRRKGSAYFRAGLQGSIKHQAASSAYHGVREMHGMSILLLLLRPSVGVLSQ